MAAYTGYLKPYVPLIAAMSLAGQSPKQISTLLLAVGVLGKLQPSTGMWNYRLSQVTGLVSYLLSTWPWRIKRRTVVGEWTPETNWQEREAVRAEG